VRTVMEQLVKYGEVKRGILGVNIVTLTPDIADNLGAKDVQGALVQQVVEGSAADKAGLKAGDVITAVNGASVKSASELRNRIGLLRVGESVELGVMRDGKLQRVVATVQTRTDSEETKAADLHHGLDGAELADAAGGGVVIRSIEPGSPASQTVLKQNDVIVGVNRTRVANLRELRAAVKDQGSLVLNVRRGNASLIVPIR
jgi:serine protease DegQ